MMPDLLHPRKEDSMVFDEVMSRHIRRVLEITGGKVGGKDGGAYLLRINPSTLRKKMRKLGIPFGRRVKDWHKQR